MDIINKAISNVVPNRPNFNICYEAIEEQIDYMMNALTDSSISLEVNIVYI